jgi:hypothetical protein
MVVVLAGEFPSMIGWVGNLGMTRRPEVVALEVLSGGSCNSLLPVRMIWELASSTIGGSSEAATTVLVVED